MSGISASAPVACRDSVARFVLPMTTWDRFARTMPPPVCFWVARCVARIRQTALLRCLDARNSRIAPEPGTLADDLVHLVDHQDEGRVFRGRLEHAVPGLGERGRPLGDQSLRPFQHGEDLVAHVLVAGRRAARRWPRPAAPR